ncbi:MAG: HAD-superfamily hydrolase, subfamily [Candidatus Saccharibacteria bacterium]|nr:HAD-superfamily hydrolase, subfamily [Candidatus Saccharibacteria bacterium]
MSQLKAVIFDADGTLLDSFELILSAYRHVAETHGLRAPGADEIRSQMGQPLPEIFKKLYPNEDIRQLLHTNSSFIAANLMASAAFEGVESLLQKLHDSGLKLGILTSGGPRVNDILRHHGFDTFFSSIVHNERLTNPKPNAEGFLLAAKECGVSPHDAAMAGDTTIDVETGKNAGAFTTIAVTHGFGLLADLEEAGADYIVSSIAAMENVLLQLIETDVKPF